MNSRNTVYAMTARNAHISHIYNVILNYRHICNLAVIARINLIKLTAKAFIDFLRYHEYSRKQALIHRDRPFFQSFGHYCMVCVRKCFCSNIPRLLPRKLIFVNKYSHKLGNTKRRVRIIYMNCNVFVQIFDFVAVF